MIKSLKIEDGRFRILNHEVPHPKLIRPGSNVRKKLTVGQRTIGAEFMEDLC